VGGAIAVALLPKCPACWSAYAGLSSLLGLSFVVEPSYLLPLTSGLLALALVPLWLQARRGRGYAPWLLACAAAAATLLGKFVLESDALLYGGVASLLLASFWSRSARARSPRAARLPLARALPAATAQN
jgi:mercuric ion transport protein